jgi:hypothetical protein
MPNATVRVCVQCLVLRFTVNNSRELQTSKRCAVLATVHSPSVQAILVTWSSRYRFSISDSSAIFWM